MISFLEQVNQLSIQFLFLQEVHVRLMESYFKSYTDCIGLIVSNGIGIQSTTNDTSTKNLKKKNKLADLTL